MKEHGIKDVFDGEKIHEMKLGCCPAFQERAPGSPMGVMGMGLRPMRVSNLKGKKNSPPDAQDSPMLGAATPLADRW